MAPSDSSPQPGGARSAAAARVPRRILVVDDNADAADSLAMLLEVRGDEVRIAYDGLEALEAEGEFRPEVVLLDIGMPKLSGYDVAKRIREARGGNVMIVAITGWGQEDDRKRARDAGFDHHFTKPVDFEVLLGLIDRQPLAAAPGA
jgi:Response regulators consisting of a CheY-like receiver domain and a winged-helix DNA-binding domain